MKKAEPKSGKSTSEFWFTSVCVILGTIIAVIGALKNNDALAAIGAALAGVSQGSYTLGRGKLKGIVAQLAAAAQPKKEEETPADGD